MSILSNTSHILFAIISNSFSFIPLAVNAGLPILIPEVTNGLLVSPGTVFLFTVIPAFPKDADAALGNAGITVNKNIVPGETRSPFVTSGIRIGSPALTARGMKEKEFELIANKICDVLDNIENTELHAKINKELEELAGNFVVYNQSTY